MRVAQNPAGGASTRIALESRLRLLYALLLQLIIELPRALIIVKSKDLSLTLCPRLGETPFENASEVRGNPLEPRIFDQRK